MATTFCSSAPCIFMLIHTHPVSIFQAILYYYNIIYYLLVSDMIQISIQDVHNTYSLMYVSYYAKVY